jgi:hypothetical protein
MLTVVWWQRVFSPEYLIPLLGNLSAISANLPQGDRYYSVRGEQTLSNRDYNSTKGATIDKTYPTIFVGYV